MNSTRVAVLIAVIVSLLIAYLVTSGDEVGSDQKVASSAIVLLSTYPLFHYFYSRRSPVAPLFALSCLYYLFAFGLPGYYFTHIPVINHLITTRSLQTGQYLCIIGLTFQLAGYYVTRAFQHDQTPYNLIGNIKAERLRFFAWGWIGIRVIMILYRPFADIPTVGQIARLAPFIGFGVLFTLLFIGKLPSFDKLVLLLFIVPVELVYRLTTGLLYELAILLILLVIIRWICNRKIDWILIVSFLSLVGIFNPAKHAYREQVWHSESRDIFTLDQKLGIFLSLTADHWLGTSDDKIQFRSGFLDRMNYLAALAVVVGQTPDGGVPYWNGRTFESAVYSFIPRILWPDKPVMTFGNEFGRTYSFLSPNDYNTSVNVNWIVELYMNWGYIGVGMGMFVVGFLFAILDRLFGTPGTRIINVVLPLSITFQLAYPESNLLGMWGGIFNVLLFVNVLARYFSTKS